MYNTESKAVEFDVPVSHVYPLMKAAKDLDADVILGKEIYEYAGTRFKKAVLLGNESLLFSLGYITGLAYVNSSICSPLTQLEEVLTNLINKSEKK